MTVRSVPDPDVAQSRQPANCPYCDHDGAFDGMGPQGDGYRHHCPSCGGEFATFGLAEFDGGDRA